MPIAGRTENSPTANPVRDCSAIFNASLQAQQTLEHDRSVFAPQEMSATQETDAAISPPSDLQRDLEILARRREDLSQCTQARGGSGTSRSAASSCSAEELLIFQMSHSGDREREIPIWRLHGDMAFFFEAGMTIDADGAPNAYHPDNTGLDDLANAGAPGNWEGLAKDAYGDPLVQGPDDPFPGYYVSVTALADRSKPVNDPERYVDASKIPYIVLPGSFARQIGARPGDFSVVLNEENGKSSYAIFGDVGPSDRIGEGSVALAENLGIRSDARNGGSRGEILYIVFPGSGNGKPRPIEEINAESEKLLQAWGGAPQLTACTVHDPPQAFEENRKGN